MNKGDIVYKCPNCDRLIPYDAYIMRKCYVQCQCGIPYYDFRHFIFDKDDEIKVDLEVQVEKTIDELIEKSYRDGYSRGYEEGEESGYSEGFDDGYEEGGE